MIFRRNRIAEQLEITNGYLALIAELMNRKDKIERYTPRKEKKAVAPVTKVDLPPSLVDASELLARWLWLQLPDESKKDLQA